MRPLLLCLLSVSSMFIATAQQSYFQQEVNYTIDVTLDDEAHTIAGTIEMEYINNSPDELQEIYFHLWPNAYSTKQTAFAKQKLRQGDTRFYYAKAQNMGNIDGLSFQVDGKNASLIPDAEHPDIALLKLPKALKSGEKVQISTPFTVKIPASYSRLGHVKTSYQMTQWYPKPAVYDHKGWHPMPYFDQGEFYSEFGSFDVSITLPKNYVVGSTGTLQTASEIAFLEEKIEDTKAYFAGDTTFFSFKNRFPDSDTETKTIRYTAENVHDFAWFADKRFKVAKGEAKLASGKKVDTWAMFTASEEKLWEKGVDYVTRSVEFYSKHVGEYPWPQATAVQSALSAGAGMEYPMITVIGRSGNAEALDEVITHEVGHNWFYGILASNERDHPWIDEGINSYYEFRYMDEYYGASSMEGMVPNVVRGKSKMTLGEGGYLFLARQNRDQAPNTHSDSLTSLNYGLGAYMKPALVFRHLEKYLGIETFDPIMHDFYNQWKFKHPYPEDIKAHFEKASKKDLDWFFDGYLFSNDKIDYAVKGMKKENNGYQLKVKNKGDIAAPFSLDFMRGDEIVQTKWIEGFKDEQLISITNGDYDKVVVDGQRVSLDLNRRDNTARIKGFPKTGSPLGLNLLGSVDDDERNNISIAPALSFNNYDKLMVGGVLHNLTVPTRKFEFVLIPMYGTKSKDLVGLGSLRYNLFPKTDAIQKVSLQLNGRSFNYNFDDVYGFHNVFYKLAPKLEVTFGKKEATSNVTQKAQYRYVKIWQDNGRGLDVETLEFERTQRDYEVHELRYELEKKDALSPLNTSATLHQGKGFTKVFAHFNQRISYSKPKKGLSIHAFGGYFINYDTPDANARFLISGTNGFGIFQKDYLYDELMFGRNDTEGIFANQLSFRDADLKTISNIGASNEWMFGGGARTTLPGLLPLDVYADAVLSPDAFEDKVNFNYSAGIAIPVVRDIFEIYFPIFESTSITESSVYQDKPGFFQRTSFRINFSKLNPIELIDGIDL